MHTAMMRKDTKIPKEYPIYPYSSPSKPTSHLFLYILGALLLDNRHRIILKHTHSLALPLGLPRLAHLLPAPPAVPIPVLVFVPATPPIAFPVIPRIATRGLAVEHVIVAVVAAASAVSVIALAGWCSAVTLVVVGVPVTASFVRLVAFGFVAVALSTAVVFGSARGVVLVV